ncbi:zinc-ribbon domain-containing protein [Actinomadura rudentiformis]|uniref:Zinc-ribbon domain-containing protein n=1 Tax=Actinomadura rudentiformis TaxID=359158 RepID=A0A6H9YI22_9ACTN|nr:zinc-ribbon domain-containing protein [Actinomadura rudentiformis]KAB2345589.1 zinc-ribbon domain-containing protein [Actinomadura rudentiformis]
MLLIFGLSVFFRTVSEGSFHCPQCGGDRAYRRRAGRRWFTLFFLPVIPLNRIGEVVECRTCRTRYSVSALRAPTAQQMAAALPAGMRAAATLVLQAGDPSDEAARGRVVEVVRGYGETRYGPDDVTADLQLRVEFLEEEVAQAGGQLAVEAKEWFLSQAVRVGLADGPLTENERQTLHRVAQLLGMSRAHALGVIVTTEGAAR